MTKFAAFHDTRNLYIDYTGYTHPLSYEEWSQKPDSQKAALLFVQFYNEITLAWDKADSLEFGDDAEGVSTVLQYLEKQVKQTQYFQKDNPTKKADSEFRLKHPEDVLVKEKRIIEEDPKKFTSSYIYRVAYNCLYCICGHDRQRDKDIINYETSAIVSYDGEELNLFDTISDKNGSIEDAIESQSFESEFWTVIENVGLPAEKVMRYLLSKDESDLKSLNARSPRYKLDPLRDVEVSLDEVDVILSELRKRFLDLSCDSACGRYVSKLLNLVEVVA